MAYRPLSHDERVIVHYVLTKEQGLDDKMASSMIAIYTAFAVRYDVAEFDVFEEGEKVWLKHHRHPVIYTVQ